MIPSDLFDLLLPKQQNFLLVTHKFPDHDAIGSLLSKIANQHNYTDLQEFKMIHKSLLENCITIVARHMHPAKI